jgi:hypothetical protein
MFGPLSRVRARANFSDATGNLLGSTEFGLDTLGVAGLDLLALSESDGLTGELADRSMRARQSRPGPRPFPQARPQH